MAEPPFTLAELEAMSIDEMDALDVDAIEAAARSIPSLDDEALEDFIAALDLLKEHKQYASAEAHQEGDPQLAEHLAAAANAAIAALAAAANAAIAALAAARSALQER